MQELVPGMGDSGLCWVLYFIVSELVSKLREKVLFTLLPPFLKQKDSLLVPSAALPGVRRRVTSINLATLAGVSLTYMYQYTGSKPNTAPAPVLELQSRGLDSLSNLFKIPEYVSPW